MRRNNVFLVFIVLSILLGCRKKEVIVRVSGNVSNSVLNQGVGSIKVKLFAKEIQGGTFSNSYKLLQQVNSDVNGNYSFEIPHRTVVDYKILIEDDLYFEYSEIINPDDWSLKEINRHDIVLSPKSYIKLQLRNQTPQSSTDNIVFVPENTNCSICFNPGLISLNGTQIDTVFRGSSLGMRFWKYTYVVTKNSMTYNYQDSVYCFAGDTATVVVAY